MGGQLKEGNERPVHITLSHDDVMRLKGTLSDYAKWHGTDYGKLTRVYMVLDAAIGAAGYYPEEQPGLHGWDDAMRLRKTEARLHRLRKELASRACQYLGTALKDECPTRAAADAALTKDMWCAPCTVRKDLKEETP